MDILANGLMVGIAVLHIWFSVLEMYLWRKPLGLKIFRMSAEQAKTTAVLAANQGLYNSFLAAGLLFGTITTRIDFQIFFLACVAIAGAYGGISVHRKIFMIQSIPAMIALFFILLPIT